MWFLYAPDYKRGRCPEDVTTLYGRFCSIFSSFRGSFQSFITLFISYFVVSCLCYVMENAARLKPVVSLMWQRWPTATGDKLRNSSEDNKADLQDLFTSLLSFLLSVVPLWYLNKNWCYRHLTSTPSSDKCWSRRKDSAQHRLPFMNPWSIHCFHLTSPSFLFLSIRLGVTRDYEPQKLFTCQYHHSLLITFTPGYSTPPLLWSLIHLYLCQAFSFLLSSFSHMHIYLLGLTIQVFHQNLVYSVYP